jgi:glucose-1-phosphate thymidylyltransferase
MGHKIQSYIQQQYQKSNLKIHFVTQEPRAGSGHAVLMARPFIEDDEGFLIMFGDTIVSCNIQQFLQTECSAIGIRKVDKPSQFGIAEIERNTSRVVKVIEKPRIPKSNLALVGMYKIEKAKMLFDAIEHLVRADRKVNEEYHLTDALMAMLEQGAEIKAMEVDGWYDCGYKETLLEANSILLNRPGFETTKGHRYPDTIIIQPVKIGEGCDISRCIIGPNVVIGDNTYINNSLISNSIVGSYSQLETVILHASILGNDTTLKGASQSLNIGDNTEINLS